MQYLPIDQIEVRDDLDALLRNLSEDENKYLRQSMEAEGWRESDSAKIWGSVIVDGMNRLRIAKELGMTQVPCTPMYFADDNECRAWMYTNQIARRNLTDQQRLLYVGQLHSVLRESMGSTEAARFIASQEGISERSVFRHAETAEAFTQVTPEFQAKFIAGDATSKELLDIIKPLWKAPEDTSLTKEQLAERARENFPKVLKGVALRVMLGVRNLRALCADVELVFKNQGIDINEYAPEIAKYREFWHEEERESKELQRMAYTDGTFVVLPDPNEEKE